MMGGVDGMRGSRTRLAVSLSLDLAGEHDWPDTLRLLSRLADGLLAGCFKDSARPNCRILTQDTRCEPAAGAKGIKTDKVCTSQQAHPFSCSGDEKTKDPVEWELGSCKLGNTSYKTFKTSGEVEIESWSRKNAKTAKMPTKL
jgi:hypothetical protein